MMNNARFIQILILMLITFLSGCKSAIGVKPSLEGLETRDVAEHSPRPTPEDTLPELIDDLSDNEPEVRVVSAYALTEYGNEAIVAIPALKANLYYEGYSEVRRSAAIALGTLGPLAQETVPDLMLVIKEDDTLRVIIAVVDALASINDASTIPTIASMLYYDEERFLSNESFHELAIVSSEAIGQLADKEFVDAGSGIYTLDKEGVPNIVSEAREWWEEDGQFRDWNSQ
jgi:HEAT repeat protein